jgi:hypothetical protein
MSFQIAALPRKRFADLFALDDAQLTQRGAKRVIADRAPGFPCRVSLEDAIPGEALVLFPFTHLDTNSPFRASGPVYVRETAHQATPAIGEVPDQLRRRLLSIRAYDGEDLMVASEVVDGRELESAVQRLLESSRVSYLHAHFAAAGCYACRIDRVGSRR